MDTTEIKSEGGRLAVSFRKLDKVMGGVKVIDGSAIRRLMPDVRMYCHKCAYHRVKTIYHNEKDIGSWQWCSKYKLPCVHVIDACQDDPVDFKRKE